MECIAPFMAGGLALEAECNDRPRAAFRVSETIGVRPEDLQADAEAQLRSTPARVLSVVLHGRSSRLHAALSDGTMLVIDQPRRSSAEPAFRPNDTIHVSQRAGSACVILAGSG